MANYTANGTYDLPNNNDYNATVNPGLTAVNFVLSDTVPASYNISSNAGSTVTIDAVSLTTAFLNINTNAGDVTLGTGLVNHLITVNATISDGGVFSLPDSLLNSLNGGSINFSAGGGTELLGDVGGINNLSTAAIVYGFTTSGADVIDDQSLKYNAFQSYVVGGINGSGQQSITVSSGNGSTLSFTVFGAHLDPGSYTSTSTGPLLLTSDGAGGGTDITPVCYVGGTRIATPQGETAVEALKIGDLILTSDGVAKPVSWIGRQTVSNRWADPLRVMPICIRAGALDENLPMRDLRLSPAHALLVDNVLVQAGALVNGVSIVREARMPTPFVYYHVEILNHSLILAEGVPAETFVDNVERVAFDNWEEHEALYPDGVTIPEMNRPRAKSHRQVPRAIRERLLARGHALFGGTAVAA